MKAGFDSHQAVLTGRLPRMWPTNASFVSQRIERVDLSQPCISQDSLQAVTVYLQSKSNPPSARPSHLAALEGMAFEGVTVMFCFDYVALCFGSVLIVT